MVLKSFVESIDLQTENLAVNAAEFYFLQLVELNCQIDDILKIRIVHNTRQAKNKKNHYLDCIDALHEVIIFGKDQVFRKCPQNRLLSLGKQRGQFRGRIEAVQLAEIFQICDGFVHLVSCFLDFPFEHFERIKKVTTLQKASQ